MVRALDKLDQWLELLERAKGWRERAQLRAMTTLEIVELIERVDDPQLSQRLTDLFEHPFDSFQPRQDDKTAGDEQAGFIDSTSLITCALGGNGSGKTLCAAIKAIEFLCAKQPPPEADTPFWIIGPQMEQCCTAAWVQKLSRLLPAEWYDKSRISWWETKRNFPRAVPLKPWPGRPGKNWVLQFKSYDQGRDAFQATEVGGAWFTEQFPYSILEEVFRGVRSYAFPGSVFMEFTPVDPAYSTDIEQKYNEWVEGKETAANWSFYHLSTYSARDAGHVQDVWFRTFAGNTSLEMQSTRLQGAFASYEGAIFKSFRPKIHLLPEFPAPPKGVIHKRSIDWGNSAEHPFVCLWAYKDAIGTWWVYDEYWCDDGEVTWDEHIQEIKHGAGREEWAAGSIYHQNTYADPSNLAGMREFTNKGVVCTPARNDVSEGIERVRMLLKLHPVTRQPRLFINQTRCPKLALQMKTYRWMRGSESGLNPKAPKPVPLKKDDDCVDALRYLVFSDWRYTSDTKSVEGSRKIKEPHKTMQFRR